MFDLIRNKRADLFKKQLHGLRIYRADGVIDSWSDKPANSRGPRPTEFVYEKFELKNPKRAWWTEFSSIMVFSSFSSPIEVNKVWIDSESRDGR